MMRRDFSAVLGVGALGFCAGCARQVAPAAAPVEGPQVADAASARTAGAACDLSGGRGVTNTAPGVFLELAGAQGDLAGILRDHPPAPHDTAPTYGFDAFVGDPRLKGLRVVHVLTPTDVAQTVPWELEGRDGATENLEFTVTPHVNGPAPEGVSVEVDVRGRAHTTVVVRDQQSIVLSGFSASVAQGTQALFVLTPYVLWNESDVGRLLACKQLHAHPGVAGGPALP